MRWPWEKQTTRKSTDHAELDELLSPRQNQSRKVEAPSAYGESIFSSRMVKKEKTLDSQLEDALRDAQEINAEDDSNEPEISPDRPARYDHVATERAREIKHWQKKLERADLEPTRRQEIIDYINYQSMFLKELENSGFLPLPEGLASKEIDSAIIKILLERTPDTKRDLATLELLRTERSQLPDVSEASSPLYTKEYQELMRHILSKATTERWDDHTVEFILAEIER